MTPDEVIASNVRRLREDVGLSVIQLAERLRVNRHRVYDYERPRRGSQHAFTWSELVRLCAVLECSLFELVLPPEGVAVDVPPWVAHGGVKAPAVELDLEDVDAGDIDREPEFGVVVVTPPGREELSQIIFHTPAAALDPIIDGAIAEKFEEWRDEVAKATEEAALTARETLWEALRAALGEGQK